MNRDYIRAGFVSNRDRVCDHFASSLVDIAYAEYDKTDPNDLLRILVEASTDLRRTHDIDWIFDIVQSALIELQKSDATLEIVLCD